MHRRELRRRERTDTCERDLAQPEHPALAGDERERQEQHRERGSAPELPEPERMEHEHESDEDAEQRNGEPEVEARVHVVDVDRRGQAAAAVRRDGAVERAADAFLLVHATCTEDVVDERHDDEDERDARQETGGEFTVGRQVVDRDGTCDAQEQPDDHRDRQAAQARRDHRRECACGQERELARVEADDRRGEDAGQPGEEHRDDPDTRRDARRVAARE